MQNYAHSVVANKICPPAYWGENNGVAPTPPQVFGCGAVIPWSGRLWLVATKATHQCHKYATDIQTKGGSFKFTRNQNPLCYKAACRFVIRHTTTLTAYMHATENVCCHIQNENIFHTAVILRDSVNNVKITIIC